MSKRVEVEHLACCRRGVERIRTSWPAFLKMRTSGLSEGRWHPAVEKVTENIVEHLFTRAPEGP